MANKKIKHIVAKLFGTSTLETLDVYDVDALHAENIVNNLTTTSAGYALDARQGNKNISGTLANQISSLNDSLGTSNVVAYEDIDNLVGNRIVATELNNFSSDGTILQLYHTQKYQITQVAFANAQHHVLCVRIKDLVTGPWSEWLEFVPAPRIAKAVIKEASWNNRLVYAFGYITGNAKTLTVFIPLPTTNELNTFTCTNIKVAMRTSNNSGGYIGGSQNVDMTSYLDDVAVTIQGIRINLVSTTTFGTNNIACTGTVNLTGTFS